MEKKKIMKAQQIAKLGLAKIDCRDNQNRPTTVIVPGSAGKQYKVEIVRHPGRIETHCYNLTERRHCLGNAVGTCYHSLTAVLVAAGEKATVHVSQSRENAKKKGGVVIPVLSGDVVTNKPVYISVKKTTKKGKG